MFTLYNVRYCIMENGAFAPKILLKFFLIFLMLSKNRNDVMI